MNRFLETVPIILTPLTPIHVGCSQNFEPTNYVIDSDVLYYFDPARLPLSDQDRSELVGAVSRKGSEAIREVQRFFHGRRAQCREASTLKVPVAAGVGRRYEERIGRVAQREVTGRAVINELAIERTAHHPHSGLPYLPGSGLKGAMRTGWLNELDRGSPVWRDRSQPPNEKGSEVEANLLGGTFQTDPFRLLDVADASGPQLRSAICFAVNRRKASLAESARGELRFERPSASVAPGPRRIDDFSAIARACNRFYLQKLKLELQVLESLTGRQWLDDFRRVVESIAPTLNTGRAMLLRVGRHSGAESITIERLRWIQIREGRDRSHWARDATTIWLAAETEDNASGMRPFGWLLVEAGEPAPQDTLQRWCESEQTTFGRQLRAVAPSTQSAAPPGPARPAAFGHYVFQKGEHVTNGDEQGVVFRNVRPTDAKMEVQFEDGIEEVPVKGWRRV
jgi:CRISPR-associated protein Csm5